MTQTALALWHTPALARRATTAASGARPSWRPRGGLTVRRCGGGRGWTRLPRRRAATTNRGGARWQSGHPARTAAAVPARGHAAGAADARGQGARRAAGDDWWWSLTDARRKRKLIGAGGCVYSTVVPGSCIVSGPNLHRTPQSICGWRRS